MITKRRLALLSALTTAPAFAAPFLAIGDNAELFLTARTEARYEDNVFLSSANEESDFIFEAVPGAEIVFGKNSNVKGKVAVFERLTAYSDNSDLNEELFTGRFDTSYEGAKMKLKTNGSFQELFQNTRDVQSNASLVRRDVTSAGINGEYSITEKSKIGSGVTYNETEYKTAGYNSQDSIYVPVSYYFAITPKVDLSSTISYRKTDVAAVNGDSEDMSYMVGARGQFTAKLFGTASIGLTNRDPEVGKDSNLLGVKSGLSYAYSPKTNFTLDLSNDFETGADASGIKVSSATFGATTEINAALSLFSSFSYHVYDYTYGVNNRTDDFINFNIGARYIYNEHLNLEAGYSISDNSSDVGPEFTQNMFRLAANFRY